MNSAILQRLIWKEYRILRSFWLATLLMTPCLAIVCRAFANWYDRELQVEDFFALTAILTSLFALGAGGIAFSTEHEIGTSEFLRRLPLDARHLWFGKLALAFVGLMALKAVLWAGASILLLMIPAHGDQLRTIWWCSWVSELELFAWGALMSLLTRQPLMAITWAVTVQSAIIHWVLPFWSGEDRWGSQSHRAGLLTDYDFALPGRTVFALCLLALSAALSTKWLSSPQPLSLLPEWWRQRLLRRRANQRSWLVAPATTQASMATTKGQLTRLMWLQWCQSRWLWGSLAVPFITSGVWLMALQPRSSHQAEYVGFLFAISTGLLWLGLGVSVFHGQQTQFRFRYFAEHGVSPARVWWSHQLALLAPLLVSVVLIAIGDVVKERPSARSATVFVDMFSGFLLAASVVFSVGQLAGMLCRQILIAAAMGCVGLLIHGLWFFLLGMAVMNPSSGYWFALWVAPFPLAWWLISRRHVNNWILERRTWVTRCRLGLSLAAPWLLMLSGLATYRVLEVPNVGVEPPTYQQLLTLSDEERQTAEMYQAVVQSLGINVEALTESYIRKQSHDEAEQQMQEIDQRLQQSPEILDRIITAANRTDGAFAGEPEQQNAIAYLIFRILHRATVPAFESKNIDRAIALVDAQRRLLNHWHRNTDYAGVRHADFLEDDNNGLLQILTRELRSRRWTAEEYHRLAHSVAEITALGRPPARRAFQRESREAFDCLNGGEWPKHLSENSRRFLATRRWLLQIPGEKARAMRLLKAWPTGLVDIYRFAQNTPWVRVLQDHILAQQSRGWVWQATSKRWHLLRAWLELQAIKAERGTSPESGEGIPGLGWVNTTGGSANSVAWIEYFPNGLLNGRAPEGFKGHGIDGTAFQITGDEPAVVFFHYPHPQDRERWHKNLLNANSSEDRERHLRSVIIEPLEPVPAQQE